MTLSWRDIEFRVDLPDVPPTMPMVHLETPCGPERAESVRALAYVLGLDDAIEVDLPFGQGLVSIRGQIEVFTASGAVRARNAASLGRFDNERRDWPDVRKVEGQGGVTYALGIRTGEQLLRQGRELLARIGLADAGVADVDVVLGQWALLDESGNELETGPGSATVRFSYSFDGVPIIGPGAKTHVHYNPVDGMPELARLFHVYRPAAAFRTVETGGIERVFDRFLADSFLLDRVERGGQVVITGVQTGLLALPADRPQRLAYPAIAVEGIVEGLRDERKGEYTLRFGRYTPAVSAETLRRAGVAIVAE
jgi:hypothetical protein